MIVDESQRMDTLDARGNWQYPSAAASGHVEVVLPALPGAPNSEERFLARDFGQHVIGKIEASMTRQGYMTSGPQQRPPEVFNHYTAVARGSGLLDGGTLRRMEGVAKEFADEPEQREYFTMVVKPWLRSLSPKRR